MIILPCPRRPDLDCIAGAYAYSEYLRHHNQPALPWICGQPDGEAQFYLEHYPHLVFATREQAAESTSSVLIDFSVKFILPPEIDPDDVIQVIDHRLFTQPELDFPNAIIQIDQVGAAATQVTEYFMRENIAPSAESAAMLYGAIYTHTLFLQSDTTTERDRAAVAWLAQYVPNAEELIAGQLAMRAHEITSQMPDILVTEMKTEQSRFGSYGFTLIEIVDIDSFWEQYAPEIKTWAHNLNHPVLVMLLDPKYNKTILYSTHANYTQALEQALQKTAQDSEFFVQPGIFRKQIIPLLAADKN
jgi:inorganic pyrophosphatase/exopolyphosphatase